MKQRREGKEEEGLFAIIHQQRHQYNSGSIRSNVNYWYW